MRPKFHLCQSDDKSKEWRPKGPAQDPKHHPSSVKHGGGVMVLAYIVATGAVYKSLNSAAISAW